MQLDTLRHREGATSIEDLVRIARHR
jgi:hypothetical protein